MLADLISKPSGYTGHIPYRYDLIGLTNGQSNQIS